MLRRRVTVSRDVPARLARDDKRQCGADLVFRYGWIANNHANGQAVRGIIVAREITQDLKLACFGLSDVELFEYEMSVAVKKIEGPYKRRSGWRRLLRVSKLRTNVIGSNRENFCDI